jgi:hypothetical protein
VKIRHTGDYRAARRAKYPPLEQLADALVHQQLGNPEPLKAYVAACAAVKAACPKPKP